MNEIARQIAEKDSAFISVMDLVKQIADKHGSSMDEAMVFLYRALSSTPEIHRPKLFLYDKAAGPKPITYASSHLLARMEKYIKAPSTGFENKKQVAEGTEDDIPF